MSRSAELVRRLIERRLTIAVAESLTGGLLVSELIATPGASETVLGGVVAYNTELKQTLLGVDAGILNVHGPVHPDVAAQMAARVRDALAVGGVSADVGVATTGVAGPDPQDGHPPGEVYVAVAINSDVRVTALTLQGDRASIRRRAMEAAVDAVLERLA
ncbi:nicotinamide-nucleotide amidohydrolase family protein [Salinibacterium sp. SYSU T00001]|uniref:CinA family protein n=1 Tax=Homoserinimonas sedimenticola TaxID=2986805 RepID=UPI0022355BF5|nr:CinA family protein [Salinibacterium sedimenticola]MCW4386764.1 nicotinamide-nucleotide amidohydrolase family protein [Salinibacterium sedimenticola]